VDNRKEYARLELGLRKFIIDYQIANDIEEEWLLRMLLDIAQLSTVRFKDSD